MRTQSEDFDLLYCPTDTMLAHGLTKPLSSEKHQGLIKSAGLKSCQPELNYHIVSRERVMIFDDADHARLDDNRDDDAINTGDAVRYN